MPAGLLLRAEGIYMICMPLATFSSRRRRQQTSNSFPRAFELIFLILSMTTRCSPMAILTGLRQHLASSPRRRPAHDVGTKISATVDACTMQAELLPSRSPGRRRRFLRRYLYWRGGYGRRFGMSGVKYRRLSDTSSRKRQGSDHCSLILFMRMARRQGAHMSGISLAWR